MEQMPEKYKEDKRKGPCKILSLNVNVIFFVLRIVENFRKINLIGRFIQCRLKYLRTYS